MKKITRLNFLKGSASLLGVGIVSSLGVPVYATSEYPEIDVYNDTMQTRALGMPTNGWNWDNGSYEGLITTMSGALYTNYYFTGTSTLTVDTNFNFAKDSSEAVNVCLYKRVDSWFGSSWEKVSTRTDAPSVCTFANLSTDTKYAIRYMFEVSGSGVLVNTSFTISK